MHLCSWWFRILLLLSILISMTIGRHIPDITKKERIFLDEVDFDEVLNQYYDDLIQELKTLHKELKKVKGTMDEAKVIEKRMANSVQIFEDIGESKRTVENSADYDYMGDAPENPTVNQNNEKVKDLMSSINESWVSSNVNTSEKMDDAKQQRESSLDSQLLDERKHFRLRNIYDTIIQLRGANQTFNESFNFGTAVVKALENIPPPSTSYPEKLQSFYPSCEIPRRADVESWSDSKSMNILFDVSYPPPLEGTNLHIMVAKLRLYKRLQENITSSGPNIASPSSWSPKTERAEINQHFGNIGTVDDGRRFRLSLYYHTHPLKKNRVKKRLIVSQMLALHGGEKYLEFDIAMVVRTWRQPGKNYGLEVIIEDEEGNYLPPERFFLPMNCSKDAASTKPLPSVLVDAAKQYIKKQSESETTSNNTVTEDQNAIQDLLYPKLDICTIEVPVSENTSIPITSCMMHQIREPMPHDFLTYLNDSLPNTVNVPTKQSTISNETRGNGHFFASVGLGTPSAGQNRNSLVPIITKSDVVATPEDNRMKNELIRLQTEATRVRHDRKRSYNYRSERE